AASGIPLEFVDHTSSRAVEVRFSSHPLPIGGKAFDIAPNGRLFDQVNRRLDGEVGIFLDPSTHSQEQFALTIAHEVGHALGLRHIDASNAHAVMDYVDFSDDKFTNGRYEVTEPPPTDPRAQGQGFFHNPLYHLRRYTLGETPEELYAAGLEPGEWDLTENVAAQCRLDSLVLSRA